MAIGHAWNRGEATEGEGGGIPDDGAVTTPKLADGSVTTAKVANAAITDNKLAAGAVTAAKISADAVNTVAIAAGAVEEEQLADDAVTKDKIADAAITRAKLRDPGGMPYAREAAVFGEGRAAVSVDASGGALEVRFKYIDTIPRADDYFFGANGGTHFRLRWMIDGALRVMRLGVILLEVENYFTGDGEGHSGSVVVSEDSQVVTRDGETIESGTGTIALSGTADYYIGSSINSKNGSDVTLWDVEVIDPNDDTNTAVFKLDAQVGGQFLNSHPGSTVDHADIVGEIGSTTINSTEPAASLLAIPQTGLERRHIKDPAGLGVHRKAAYFNGEIGNVIQLSWAPSGDNFTYEFKAYIVEVESGQQAQLVGRAATNYAEVRFTNSGDVQAVVSGSSILTVDDEAVFPTAWDLWSVSFSATGGTISRNGVQIGEVTGLTNTFTDAANNVYIGAGDTSNRPLKGAMWDVKLIDHDDATNTAVFPLDGQKEGGGYANAAADATSIHYTASTVADATVTGFIQDAAVLSTEGAAGPVILVDSDWLTVPTEDIAGNDTDTPFYIENGADRDMRIRIKAGATNQYRAYLDWRDESDANTWLLGVNRDNDQILYDTEGLAHRIQCNTGGTTQISSAGTDAVRINGHDDNGSGTGGLEIYDGGSTKVQTHTFKTTGSSVRLPLEVKDPSGIAIHQLGAETAGQYISGSAGGVLLQFRNNRTADTGQSIRIGARHYSGTGSTMAMLQASNSAGSNVLAIGGGTGSMQAVTQLSLYAGSGITAGAGVEIARISTHGMHIEPAGASSVAATCAALEVSSTVKGFLPPRMTSTQRDAIGSLEEGLTIWNTTSKALESYDGTSWA